MNVKILQEAGLTNAQAAAYAALAEHSPCTPPKLAELIGESRTNTYKILEQLEAINLVSRDETEKKLRYWANNPSLLVDAIKKRRLAAEAAEKRFADSLPALMAEYFDYSERPGVRFFQGKDGINAMYDDQLSTGRDITMVRTRADIGFFGSFEAVSSIRSRFNSSPIHRHMLTPDSPETRANWAEHDQKSGNTRTWIAAEDYTAPVEWAAYGDKLAILSFGEEAMGMIIHSEQIAESFRQLLKLADSGAHAHPEYSKLPKLASKTLEY